MLKLTVLGFKARHLSGSTMYNIGRETVRDWDGFPKASRLVALVEDKLFSLVCVRPYTTGAKLLGWL